MMNKILKIIGEVIYPENIYCIACGEPIKKGNFYSLCVRCKDNLLFNRPQSCLRCGKFTKPKARGFCEGCISKPPNYDSGCAAIVYGKEARKIIYSLKYGGKGYLAKNMAFIINGAVKSIGEYDIIVPVPMFLDKRKQRGFCQTTLIAKKLSELTGKKVSQDNLIRTRNTPPMSGLNIEERRKNIKNAFKILDAEEFKEKRILLVDDILTTGSTADECSELLKKAGAEAVLLAVFAATYERRD